MAANGVAGIVAVVALIVVLVSAGRIARVERTVTTIHRQIIELQVRGVRPGKGKPPIPPIGLPAGVVELARPPFSSRILFAAAYDQ